MGRRIGKYKVSQKEYLMNTTDNAGYSTGTIAVTGAGTFAGGYGSTGVTINAAGNIQSNGTLTIDGISTLTGVATFTGQTISNGGTVENTTVTDENSQHATILAAEAKGGIVVHTSTTGGGNITTDTASNYVSGLPLSNDGDTFKFYFINDGDQVDTFVGGTGVTLADAGQTVAENESCIVVLRRTGATAVTLYTIGA